MNNTRIVSAMDDGIFSTLFENSPIGIEIFDKNGFLTNVNSAGLKHFGASDMEGLKGFSFFDDPMFPDDMKKRLRNGESCRFDAVFDFDKARELGLFETSKTGTIVLDMLFTPLTLKKGGSVDGYLVQVQDITERKVVEKELGLFSAAMEYAMDGIQIVDMDGHIIYSNRAVEELYGYTSKELKGMHVSDMNVESEFAVNEILPSIMQKGRWEGEIMVKRKGGVEFPIWLSTSLIKNSDGLPIAMVGIIRDITELKKADAALRDRERQLSESQRIAHVGSWEHNLTTNEVIWSDELFRLLGLDPGKDPADFNMFFEMIHPDDKPRLKNAVENTLKTGEHFSIEYKFILRDGRTRIIYAQAELISDETSKQRILSGTGQDITERKLVEESLKESQDLIETILEATPT